jgi:hypothetical protein
MALADFNLDSTNAILVTEAGKISDDIHEKTINESAWIKLAPRSQFPDEQGDTINVLTWERALPTNGLSWTALTNQAIGVTTSCLPTPGDLTFGKTVRSYGLQSSALQTPKICVNDLRFASKRKEQLTAMFNILKYNTKWAWENFYRGQYTAIAEHKLVLTAGMTSIEGDSADFAVPADPTKVGKISQGVLDRIYLRNVREGVEPWGMENARPIYALMCSPEAQEQILFGLGVQNIREDFRYSTRVSELLAPLGVERSYKGWYHLMDMFPTRTNIVDGAWVEVAPFIASSTTAGSKWNLNPAYETASFEDAQVFVRESVEFQVPRPLTNPGGGVTFDPLTYMGDFQWSNIKHEDTNPDGTIGRFRAVFQAATKPIQPDLATVIRFRRCGSSLVLSDCDGEVIVA